MKIRLQPWHLAVIVVAVCAAVLAALRWRSNRPFQTAELVATLPARDAILVYVDAAALRQAGMLDLLAGSKAVEEADYRRFVDQIGFDYRTDLDTVAGAFTSDASYFAVRGRFQWQQLANYATMQGGTCRNTVCNVPGAIPERNISFYPLKKDVLAVAFSSDPRAVMSIGLPARAPSGGFPAEPVWVLVPEARLASGELWPGATALIAPPGMAHQVTIAAGAADALATRLQFRVAVDYKTSSDAAQFKDQLAHLPAGPLDSLAGLLASGTFEQHSNQVSAVWKVDRAVLQSVVGAAVP